MLIDGIHVPLATPFYRDGRSYLRKLEHNVARYSLTPAAGFVVLPPGGEAAGLSDEEVRETLEIVSATAAPEKVLLAGITADSVIGALRLAEQAATAGFDAVLLGAPTQWPQLRQGDEHSELLVYFRAVADAASLPVVLWSDAAAPSKELHVPGIAELARHGNIIGLYDTDLSLARYGEIAAATAGVQHEATVTTVFAPFTRRMKAPAAVGAATFVSAESLGGGTALATAPPVAAVKTRTKKVGFQIMAAGQAHNLVPLLEAGVAGALPRLAACAPQACHEVYAALKDGDTALAVEKAQRLIEADALMAELGTAGVKFGCDLNGYYGGAPRLPRLPLNATDRERVERILNPLRN